MTTTEINIAIAEACGWIWYRLPISALGGDRRYRCLFHPQMHEYNGQPAIWQVRADGSEAICNIEYMVSEGHIPDYCNDLNAMHSAEGLMWASSSLWERYSLELGKLSESLAPVLHATSAQRAKAFLRTIGKWRDE